jgi:ACS family hexuronate transporter-like MFS transporter
VNFGILIFDCNALNFLMRFEQPDLRLSNTQVSLLASAFPLTWALAGVVANRLSDRIGSRKPILRPGWNWDEVRRVATAVG